MGGVNSRSLIEVIYAEPSLNIFYVDTFYLYPSPVRELDYVVLLKLCGGSVDSTEYVLCALEEVSDSKEEIKVASDRILGLTPIFWADKQEEDGQRRLHIKEFGVPLVLGAKTLYASIKKRANCIRDKLESTLWVDAELHNLIYYSVFFLSKKRARDLLEDITKISSNPSSERCCAGFLSSLAKMLIGVMDESCEELTVPSFCEYSKENILEKAKGDLQIDKGDELIVLFMVQRISDVGGAYEMRTKYQAECIENILSTLGKNVRAYILSNNYIREQVNDVRNKIGCEIGVVWEDKKPSNTQELIDDVLSKSKKVMLIILSDYRKRSVQEIIKKLPKASCILVIPESRIEPKPSGERLVDIEWRYFKDEIKNKKLYDVRVLYLSPKDVETLKNVFGD